jgi:hypothetical protein
MSEMPESTTRPPAEPAWPALLLLDDARGTAPADPGELMLTCANCGAPMDERKCKLICRCGYFLSCSDYL